MRDLGSSFTVYWCQGPPGRGYVAQVSWGASVGILEFEAESKLLEPKGREGSMRPVLRVVG